MPTNRARKTKNWTRQDVIFVAMLAAVAGLSYVLLHH
jgi:hypothetical protein